MLQEQIITALIAAIFAGGYSITLNDGDDDVLHKSFDADRIIKNMNSTEADIFKVYNQDQYIGFILLIPGNGDDIVSNHSGNEIIENIVDKVLEDLGVL